MAEMGHSRRIDTAPPVAACPLRLHRALALRSLCDGHHKKALFIAELRKKNRAFLTAPALAGISSNLMRSQEATDDCRRGRSASALMHKSVTMVQTWRRIMKALIAAALSGFDRLHGRVPTDDVSIAR